MCEIGLMIMQICFYLFQVKRCCPSTYSSSCLKTLEKGGERTTTWQQATISAHLHVSKQQRGNKQIAD